MGGDGTIMQCAQGLVMATARNAGIDINNADSTLPTTSIRMGILPAGDPFALVKQNIPPCLFLKNNGTHFSYMN